MIKIITTILLIISFFYPLQASWIFVAFLVFLEGYLFLSSKKRKYSFSKDTCFNEEEQKIIEKYHLYFRYPFTARSLSTSLSFISISAILFVPWLLYNYLWPQAIIIGLNYFIAQLLSTKLNIRFYLHDAVERLKKEEHRKEMMMVDSICEKISDSK